MKRRLLDLVRCPACGGKLTLHVIAEEAEAVDVPVPSPACARYCVLHDRIIEPADAAFRPDCRACYGADVSVGILSCAACDLLYPIVRGVPRLVRNAFHEYEPFFFAHRDAIGRLDGHRAAAERLGRADLATFDQRSNDSFSLQWQQYQYDDKTWFKDDLALRRGEFLESLDVSEDQLHGALVLDAGCGNGKLTSTITAFGAEVVGMDLSRSIERANANRKAIAGDRAMFVHFLQGNVMDPPFAPEFFACVHSSGVLHHTPDTERAFRSLLPLVQLSGRIYVQLYRRREAWVGIPNRLLRAITSRLPVGLLYRLCYAAVPLHTALVLLVARAAASSKPHYRPPTDSRWGP